MSGATLDFMNSGINRRSACAAMVGVPGLAIGRSGEPLPRQGAEFPSALAFCVGTAAPLKPLAITWIYYVSEWAFMWLDIGGWAFDETKNVNRICVELIGQDSDRTLLARVYDGSRIVPAPPPTAISVNVPRAKGTAVIVMQVAAEGRPFGWVASGVIAASRDAMDRGLRPHLVLVEGITNGPGGDGADPSSATQSRIDAMIRLGFSTPTLLRWASPPEDQHDCFYGKCYTNLLLDELARRKDLAT